MGAVPELAEQGESAGTGVWGDGMAELAVMERGVGGLGMQGGRELCRQKCQTSAVIEIK